MTDYYVVAMSHIDMGFVMREEAQAELVEILLERVINLLERHPQIYFALEQAAHYRGLEKRRPDLFAKVKELLKEGRLEFLGGMATTAETNFPDGECLVRNQGMGLNWVKEHLDVSPKFGWLVDTFGINAQVPQIMNEFGFTKLFANRFGCDKRFDTFLDEGLDGSKVLVVGTDLGSPNVLPDRNTLIFCKNWGDVDLLFKKAEELKAKGPKLVNYYLENEEVYSEYYMELVKEHNAEGNWKYSTYQEFLDALEDYGCDDLPTLHGDLNPEFTGTFALRTPIRVANRKSEIALIDTEIWEALLGTANSESKEAMEECWWDIFYCQFHDVFSGSHEDITFEKVMQKYNKMQETAKSVLKKALCMEADKQSIVCCNSLPWARTDWVEATLPDREEKIIFPVDMPAGSIKTLKTDEIQALKEAQPTGKGNSISNEFLQLELSERNGIEALTDTEGNCFVHQAADFLIAQRDIGNLQIEDAQDIEIFAATGDVSVEEAVADEMNESIIMKGKFKRMWWANENSLEWEAKFSLRKGEKALRLKVTLDWKGQETRIRFRVPGNFHATDIYHEIPFGIVERETYRNRSTARGEWPARKFAAMEGIQKSGKKMGIALINKGVAGVEQEGNAITTTLIRAYGSKCDPWIKPSPISSQWGKQTFEFMLVPYMGDYHQAKVVKMSQEFNQPVMGIYGKSKLNISSESLYAIEESNLVLSTIKRAWDDSEDLVIRIYESEGIATTGHVMINGLQKVSVSDMTEIKKQDISSLVSKKDVLTLDFKPFEIKTLRIVRNLKY